MEELKITLIQSDLYWENPKENRTHFEKLINAVSETHLIVLPEMFTTGFSMDSEQLAETMQGETVRWMKNIATERQAAVCGSLIIEEKGKYYNRLIWVTPEGEVEKYDKRHLFRMANENEYFSYGTEKLIIQYKGWKICPLICYDLRFPVWSRNKSEEYDLLLFIANWPEARISAWEKLLYARAIENQCYVAAVNRIGKDGKDIQYSGSSMLIDAKGELVWKAKDFLEGIKTITIEKSSLKNFRKKFPLTMDADDFELR